MMRNLLAGFVILMLALGVGSIPALAASMTAEQYEQKLKSYDARAIEAAKFYARTFDLIGGWKRSAPQMEQGMTRQLKTKNPDITEEQTKLFIKAVEGVVLTEGAETMERASVIALLELMTKDELLALQAFYVTPVGMSILSKFPAYSERLAEIKGVMKSEILPRALEAAKAKLKENGVDVKM